MAISITESTYYILLATLRPNHGYGIIQKVQQLTNERVVIGSGTLYGAINTLLEKGWISLYSKEIDARKKKEYIITDLGKEILKNEISRLEELMNDGKGELKRND